MIEFLQYYTSGFWVWAGITIGVSVAAGGFGSAFGAAFAMMRGR